MQEAPISCLVAVKVTPALMRALVMKKLPLPTTPKTWRAPAVARVRPIASATVVRSFKNALLLNNIPCQGDAGLVSVLRYCSCAPYGGAREGWDEPALAWSNAPPLRGATGRSAARGTRAPRGLVPSARMARLL